jgi:hypothetical protein
MSEYSSALPKDVIQAGPFQIMCCFAQCLLHVLQMSITAMQLAAQTLVALVHDVLGRFRSQAG